MLDQIGGERWQTIVLTLRPLILDRHIAPHDKARVIQSLVESGNSSCEQLTRGKPEQNVPIYDGLKIQETLILR